MYFVVQANLMLIHGSVNYHVMARRGRGLLVVLDGLCAQSEESLNAIIVPNGM